MDSAMFSAPMKAGRMDEPVSVTQRRGPGVLVVGPGLQVLHCNRRATELMGVLSGGKHLDAGSVSGKRLPHPELAGFSRALERVRLWRAGQSNRGMVTATRVLREGSQSILVRGIAMPERGRGRQPWMVILLEELGRQRTLSGEVLRERYQLTPREATVLQALAKGSTNKHIADELGLSLSTVKEHIHRIMEKTKSTTRTMVLVNVLRS